MDINLLRSEMMEQELNLLIENRAKQAKAERRLKEAQSCFREAAKRRYNRLLRAAHFEAMSASHAELSRSYETRAALVAEPGGGGHRLNARM